jgi:hypothetical protein
VCVRAPTYGISRGRIGETFLQWPAETKFISPSFTGNFFGSVDLNAITPDSSPAYGLQTEHPSGAEYCRYLNDVASTTRIDVRTGIEVLDVVGAEVQPKQGPPPQFAAAAAEAGAGTEGAATRVLDGTADEPHSVAPGSEGGPAVAPDATMHDASADAAEAPTPHDEHQHDHHHHHHHHHQQPPEPEEVDLESIPTITVHTSKGAFGCKFFVWAGGEAQYPKVLPNTVRPGASYRDMPVGKHVIIGGGESGMDAALNLIRSACCTSSLSRSLDLALALQLSRAMLVRGSRPLGGRGQRHALSSLASFAMSMLPGTARRSQSSTRAHRGRSGCRTRRTG